MSDSSHESKNNGMTIFVGVVAVLFFAGSAVLTLIMWVLGVGVDRTLHNLMGWVFLAIHAAFFAMVRRALTMRRHGAALTFGIAPAFVSVGTLAAVVSGCTHLARC